MLNGWKRKMRMTIAIATACRSTTARSKALLSFFSWVTSDFTLIIPDPVRFKERHPARAARHIKMSAFRRQIAADKVSPLCD